MAEFHKNLGLKLLTAGAVVGLAVLPQPGNAGLLGDAISKSLNNHGSGPTYTEHAESFKGLSQVVIGQFSVVFLTKKVDYDGGGFFSGADKAKAIGQLAGVSEADYQRITDEVYADFSKKLVASGVTIVDPADYYASQYYQKVKSEEQGHKVTIPLQDQDTADGIAYWPSGMAHRDNMALTLRFMDFGMANVSTAQWAYARASKVPVLNVVYVVDFAAPAKSSGGGILQTIKSTAELAISNRGSLFLLMDTQGKPGKLILNKPLVEAGGFAEIKDITSGATKAMETGQSVMNLAGAFMGKGSSMFGKKMRMDRRFEYNVTDTANYAGMAAHAGGQANDLMLSQMVGLR